MTRAALYARYSSDAQSAASIEDQSRLCREQAGRERWQIVGSYEDAAISGPAPFSVPASKNSCAMRRAARSRSSWPRRWTASAEIRPMSQRCTNI